MNNGKENTPHQAPKIGLIAGVCATFSVVLCYGTLMIINALHYFGVAISLNETLWAGGIMTTATLAVFGLLLGLFRHKNPWPLIIGTLGTTIIAYALYVDYAIAIEVTGFTFLCLAAIWDLKLTKTPAASLAG